MSAFHNQQTTADGIHILVRWEYVDVTAMYAFAYTAADEGGLARVGAAAPYNFYLLKDSAGGGGAAGWADVAQGTGDFSGPAAATAGHALAFADATGKLASDSGRVAANIPSGLPIQFAEGGTGATTQQAGMEALSPAIAHTAYVNGAYTGTGTGSVNAPFATISAALAFIGPATNAAEEEEIWVVEVASGFYDESLVIPELRIITLNCDGLIILSNAALASIQTVTLNNISAPATALGAVVTLNNFFLTSAFIVSGNVAGAKCELVLDNVGWVNNGASPCIDSTGWPLGPELRFKLRGCRLGTTGAALITSNTAHPQADVSLSEMIRCDTSGGSITVGGYGHINASRFNGDLVFKWTAGATTGSNVSMPVGFFGCEWSNPSMYNFSAQMAGDFRLDASSNISAVLVNIGGAGAFTTDPHKGLSNAYYPMGAQWVQIAQEHNMMKALDRLATVVQGLSGGVPIP